MGVPLEPVTTSLFCIISLSGMILALLTLRSIRSSEDGIAVAYIRSRTA
jgi:hypothetical protein